MGMGGYVEVLERVGKGVFRILIVFVAHWVVGVIGGVIGQVVKFFLTDGMWRVRGEALEGRRD